MWAFRQNNQVSYKGSQGFPTHKSGRSWALLKFGTGKVRGSRVPTLHFIGKSKSQIEYWKRPHGVMKTGRCGSMGTILETSYHKDRDNHVLISAIYFF